MESDAENRAEGGGRVNAGMESYGHGKITNSRINGDWSSSERIIGE
jgi:hypothetical protein